MYNKYIVGNVILNCPIINTHLKLCPVDKHCTMYLVHCLNLVIYIVLIYILLAFKLIYNGEKALLWGSTRRFFFQLTLLAI